VNRFANLVNGLLEIPTGAQDLPDPRRPEIHQA
jgi:hypothetical protein